MAPVKGTVTYRGKPLEFGSVMFQPESGQPARGEIQPDGSFQLYTLKPGDGAAVGMNQVRITCREEQRPKTSPPKGSDQEAVLGKPLIPIRYSSFEQSRLTFDVKPGSTNTAVFELTDE